MAFQRSYNKNNNTTYVYETVIVENNKTGKETKKRKLVGKIDVNTGKLIPTDRRGRRAGTTDLEWLKKPELAPEYEELKEHFLKERKLRQEAERKLAETQAMLKKAKSEIEILALTLDKTASALRKVL